MFLALAWPHAAYAHGELHVRILALTRQIATNPAPALYLERGELYRQHQEWDPAQADYSKAAELGCPASEVDFCRASLLADRGELLAAKKLLDELLQRSPKEGKAFVARARVLVRLGQVQAAAPDFERGLALLPTPEPEAFREWAQALASQARVDDAVKALDQGVRRLGPLISLESCALDLELGRNHQEAALTRLNIIIEQADRKERWLARRGALQAALGRTGEAHQSYEAALAAIKRLPQVLQRNPSMSELRTQINAALAQLAAPSRAGTNSLAGTP